ncbi:hypothetical protein [Thalassobius sp. Cn5-15]|jgi:hypothetical protein|uniref:hypothetical protein n=1 Tax=Thalassobius sp. Cn5-15 TaxID=2917763 RepID=UPI001EF36C1D|nr:hypothetical protein [Thalassobius sp. Cn5-15]MCG7493427.1 hypothetical protein [Thalassobius sp. Cn5-15]
MLELLSVRPQEPRGVRLFSLAADQAELDRLGAILANAEPGLAKGHLADLFGVEAIDATRVEVFDLADLSDFGLMNYLIKANGLPEEALEPDRARLEALAGVVLILYPQVFKGESVTLSPVSAVTPIGAWSEEVPDLEFTPLRSQSAVGELLQGSAPAAPTPTPRWVYLMTAAMVLLGCLAIYAALTGGA